jgi:hypothetical protein
MSSADVIFMKVLMLSVCLYVYVARQRLGKNITATTDTQAAIQLSDSPFSMQSVRIKTEFVGLS